MEAYADVTVDEDEMRMAQEKIQQLQRPLYRYGHYHLWWSRLSHKALVETGSVDVQERSSSKWSGRQSTCPSGIQTQNQWNSWSGCFWIYWVKWINRKRWGWRDAQTESKVADQIGTDDHTIDPSVRYWLRKSSVILALPWKQAKQDDSNDTQQPIGECQVSFHLLRIKAYPGLS